ncbi:ComF family protein [Maridesulfovibrio sp.]|uniref:ComF family protein n=1 Tax=Maridesulfovibrio sp. TaxID=2795000 RepID=UPI002A1874EA|nr:ComF family protein [Maridesulfovibrio sp.]
MQTQFPLSIPFKTASAILRRIFGDRRCVLCRSVYTGESPLCPRCLALLTAEQAETSLSRQHPESSYNSENPAHAFSKVYSCGSYTGILRDMILAWKFNGRTEFGSVFRGMIAESADRIGRDCRPELIVPVPLHPSRLRKRGFNQSLVLAKYISAFSDSPLDKKSLARVRKTIPQSSLSGDERRENLHGAFAAEHHAFSGKRILLVDDVFTTGSTVGECARTMLEAGAEEINVLVLARARRNDSTLNTIHSFGNGI